jgi:hypothetical protein
MTTYNRQSNVAIGDLYTASMHNTLLDNLHAFWTNAVSGGMPYWSAANTVAALAKPTARGVLRHDGSVPSWLEYGASEAQKVLRVNDAGNGVEFGDAGQQFCVVKNTAHVSLTTSESTLTWADDVFDDYGWHSTVSGTQWITPNIEGWYIASLYYEATASGGSGNSYWTARCYAPSSQVFTDRRLFNVDAFSRMALICTPPIYCDGAGNALGWTIQHQDGAVRSLLPGSRFAVHRIA